MRLCLRIQDIGWMVIGVHRPGKELRWQRKEARPETFLNTLLAALKKWKIKPDELTSIACVKGPGSFTALRGGFTIANTLAFALQIPMAGITAKGEEADDKVMERLTKAKIGKTPWLIPSYGAPAKITKPKHRTFA